MYCRSTASKEEEEEAKVMKGFGYLWTKKETLDE